MGNYLVIKCGGSVLENLPQTFYENVVSLQKSGQYHPIIVHGGGPMISSYLDKLNIQTIFQDGLRVTTNEVLDVVEMVLSGSVNKKVVAHLTKAGGKSLGLSGVDGHLIKAISSEESTQLGFVGEVEKVESYLIKQLVDMGYIPVISPTGLDDKGQRYNINGDTAAAAIAKSLGANLCFISDIPGIYIVESGRKQTLKHISSKDIHKLIDTKMIHGGMIPKVKAALSVLEENVSEVSIISGLIENSLLNYAEGEDVGTKITCHEEVS